MRYGLILSSPKLIAKKSPTTRNNFVHGSVTCSTTMSVMTLAISFTISQTISSEKTLDLYDTYF